MDMRWAMYHHIIFDNGETIADATRQGMVIVVMDWLYKAHLGTMAFLIKGDNSKNHLVVVNQPPRYPED